MGLESTLCLTASGLSYLLSVDVTEDVAERWMGTATRYQGRNRWIVGLQRHEKLARLEYIGWRSALGLVTVDLTSYYD